MLSLISCTATPIGMTNIKSRFAASTCTWLRDLLNDVDQLRVRKARWTARKDKQKAKEKGSPVTIATRQATLLENAPCLKVRARARIFIRRQWGYWQPGCVGKRSKGKGHEFGKGK